VIEDELRSLLTERAGALPENPARSAEVGSRITGIRRRRIAGAALGLVLVALAGLAVLRLPGTNESLPPGVPAPPWFDDIGNAAVPGYTQVRSERDLTEPREHLIPAGHDTDYSRHLVVARCQRPAVGTVRNNNGPRFEVDCARRVDDHFEGVTALAPGQARLLFEATPSGGPNIWFESGSEGEWVIAILKANAPESLPQNLAPGSRLLAEGTRTRTGTTVEITVPPARVLDPGERSEIAMGFTTDCVAGVRLTFTVPAGELGTANCDPLGKGMNDGKVATYVTKRQLAQLGLRPGDRVQLTIRSVGRDTDQWRVFPPN
jgi:hypothetical protein